ncbi:hypothetical protein CRENBAI_014913, partial [Crenichthys baileyi]
MTVGSLAGSLLIPAYLGPPSATPFTLLLPRTLGLQTLLGSISTNFSLNRGNPLFFLPSPSGVPPHS